MVRPHHLIHKLQAESKSFLPAYRSCMIEEGINLNHEKAENLKDVQRNANVT